ncbi:MAG: LPP20 family lipoprotein [Candidatus Cloacimonetes bacterium]|nr:LPP20 family lipoprotein [Candidatus Cloacimonadota bacterium]
MLKKNKQLLIILSMMMFLLASLACASSPPPPSAPQRSDADISRDAARDAFSDMDRQLGTGGQQPVVTPPTPPPPPPPPTTPTTPPLPTGRPMWVDSPDMEFNRGLYVTGLGHGTTRDMAERNAIANLTAFFGQSIQADQAVTNTYFEAIRGGQLTDWTDDIAIQSTVRTRATMDLLVGAEIRGVWHDVSANTFYAIAVMERAATIQIYSDMIRANQNMIENLINMPADIRGSMTGYTRLTFAAVVADINVTLGNVLSVLGAQAPIQIVNGNTYRLEAQNVAATIPIGVRVSGDRAGRVQGAFARAISELGFRSGGNNARYMVDCNIVISPVELAANQNTFVRIELSANLVDTSNNTVMLPWNFNERHGHLNATEAENRAFNATERKIVDEYKDYLSNYLARLIPQR